MSAESGSCTWVDSNGKHRARYWRRMPLPGGGFVYWVWNEKGEVTRTDPVPPV